MAMASCGVLSCGESASAAAGRLASMLRSTVGALKGRAAIVGRLDAGVRVGYSDSNGPVEGAFGGDDVVAGVG